MSDLAVFLRSYWLTEAGRQHAFPHDFRSGPSLIDWDPSKWIILALHRMGFASGLRRARTDDLQEAAHYMQHKLSHGALPPDCGEEWYGDVWEMERVDDYIKAKAGRCVILVDGFVVDVSGYVGEHVRCTFMCLRGRN